MYMRLYMRHDNQFNSGRPIVQSQNGWPASPNLKRRSLTVGGVSVVGGIVDNPDVATVLGYVAEQFHTRVERLVNPGCWGFYFRANRNDPSSLSNHSSGTAIDLNAPKHPNGVPTGRTFSAKQVAEVHKILAEVDHVVRWGGDYTRTVDSMHFEIIGSAGSVARVAAKLRAPAKVAPKPAGKTRRPEVQAALAALRKVRDTAKNAVGRKRAQESIDDVKHDFPGSGK
jgi:hypothetical protein